MFIQGANNPIVITFDTDVSNLPKLVVTLWRDRNGYNSTLLKKWEKEDMLISGDTAICQISEIDTGALVPKPHVLEAKGLDGNGNTIFWYAFDIDVLNRRDKNILLTRAG